MTPMKTQFLDVPQAPTALSQPRGIARVALALVAVAVSVLTLGCNDAGIGDPCIPEDEYQKDFAGYSYKEVNVESRSFQCETRVCLVNKFQGRVSCKYGAKSEEGNQDQTCMTPDGQEAVDVAVDPQLVDRRPVKSVYCSCRCAGINGVTNDGAPYCECPSGFRCEDLIKDFGLGNKQLAGGYCVKENTNPNPDAIDKQKCTSPNCGDKSNPYE
jgi:hypothetical protein